MIRYNKAGHKKSVTKKTYRFMKVGNLDTGDGENFFGFSHPEMALNLRAVDGEIRNTKGFDVFAPKINIQPAVPRFDVNLVRVFKHYVGDGSGDNRAYIVMTDRKNNVYRIEPGMNHIPLLIGTTDSEVIDMVDFRQDSGDIGVLTTFLGLYVLHGGELSPVENAPSATCICAHKGRLFAVRSDGQGRLWFSDVMDVTNWNASLSEGGYIDLEPGVGDIKKLISLGEYLYCFCENSIWRVTAYGDQREFSVQKIADTTGRIEHSSAGLVGTAMYFVTDAGFFRFDGWNIVKIMPELDGIVPYIGSVKAVASHGTELLYSLIMQKGGPIDITDTKYLLVRYDVYSGAVSLSQGYPIKSMVGIKFFGGSLLATTQDDYKGNGAMYYLGYEVDAGASFGTPVNKVYRTGASDLGVPDMKKLVRRVTVSAECPSTVKVKTDVEECVLSAPAGIGVTLRPRVKGRTVSIELFTDADEVRIVNPTVSVDVFE